MESSCNYAQVYIHILRRSLIIFFIGFALTIIEFYDSHYAWSTFKYMGVLQRIGVSYLLAAALFVSKGVRGHAIWIFVGPLIYWLLLLFVSVPGFGAGNLEPAGNAASYIDVALLGQHGGNPHSLLSLLTTTATISFGVLTGHQLKMDNLGRNTTMWMLLIGVGLVLMGEIAGQWLPVNRRLWTPSFVLLTAGVSTLTFCAFFWIIEVVNFRKWTKPFVVFGRNPILIFSFSEFGRIVAGKGGITLADGHWISYWDYAYRMSFLKIASPINASLLFSITYVFIFFILGNVLYRKACFVHI
jgi:predicted acyltransferase